MTGEFATPSPDPAWAGAPINPMPVADGPPGPPISIAVPALVRRGDGFSKPSTTAPRWRSTGCSGPGRTSLPFRRCSTAMKTTPSTPGSESAATFGEWWLRRMIQTPYPLLEKMTLFWHGHFAVRNLPVRNGRLMARYVRMLRQHALGRFQPLLDAVIADPAVRLTYNASANRRRMPVLDLWRTVLDQFTLGPGQATERDVQETARRSSGLTVMRVPVPYARAKSRRRHEDDSGRNRPLGRGRRGAADPAEPCHGAAPGPSVPSLVHLGGRRAE